MRWSLGCKVFTSDTIREWKWEEEGEAELWCRPNPTKPRSTCRSPGTRVSGLSVPSLVTGAPASLTHWTRLPWDEVSGKAFLCHSGRR